MIQCDWVADARSRDEEVAKENAGREFIDRDFLSEEELPAAVKSGQEVRQRLSHMAQNDPELGKPLECSRKNQPENMGACICGP